MNARSPKTPGVSRGNGPTPKPRGQALPLTVVGCDFRVASSAWRDAVLLDASARAVLLERLGRSAGAVGLVVLETCNRVEWLIEAPDPRWTADLARAAMQAQWRAAGMTGPLPTPYVAVEEDAVRHLARVVVGLESFVVGEREIAGQLNRAMDQARLGRQASAGLNALQTTLGRIVRAVERGTAFRAHTRGVHSLAVEAVGAAIDESGANAAAVGDAAAALVVVFGMGEIGRKTAALAARDPRLRVVCVNRSVDAAHAGSYRGLEALPALLADADALIVATGARSPVVDAAMVADRVPGRAHGRAPLFIVDLGAPAQVAPALQLRPDMRIVGLDDLLAAHVEHIDEALRVRVEALVEDAVAEARLVAHKRASAALLRAVWDGYDSLAWGALPELIDNVGAGLPEEARRALADGLREAFRAHCRSIVAAVEKR